MTTEKCNWSKFTERDMSQINLELDWNFSSDDLTSEEMWKELHGKLQIFEASVPLTKLKIDHNGRVIQKDPWESSALKKSRKTKDKMWREFEKYPNSKSLNIAQYAQKHYEDHLTKEVLKYERKITSSMKSNPKRFFSYLNSKRKIRNTLTNVKMADGNMTATPKETANVLANFFASTYTSEDSDSPEIQQKDCPEIGNLNFEASEIKSILQNLKISKSMGPDGVHPKLLRFLSTDDSFINAIVKLFQQTYESGEMPSIWKCASVTALHKKGTRSNAGNYRPISLTCILSKVFEKILRNQVLDHFAPEVYKNQHGFLPRRSCLSNLLDCMDHVYDILDNDEDADIIYLDFMKAFDSVAHKRLLTKLKAYGIAGKTWSIIENFLSNRTFRVRVGDTFSDWYKVTSGVPQGSVLGPLLFIIFINDLPNGLYSYISLFADDVKLICSTKNVKKTQADLDALKAWQNSWLLKFNTTDNKCKVLHVGKNNERNQYYLNGEVLPATVMEKDLGVYVEPDLKWKYQIQKSINKVNASPGCPQFEL